MKRRLITLGDIRVATPLEEELSGKGEGERSEKKKSRAGEACQMAIR